MLSVKRAFRAVLVRAGLDPNMQDVRNLLRYSAAVHMAEDGDGVCAVFAELPETSSECVGMLEIPNDIK